MGVLLRSRQLLNCYRSQCCLLSIDGLRLARHLPFPILRLPSADVYNKDDLVDALPPEILAPPSQHSLLPLSTRITDWYRN